MTWQLIVSAPRDGTVIEIQNNWGVAPHYCLCKWIHGRGWVYASDDNRGLIDGEHLTWRPYEGEDASKYVDPTNGAQDTKAYWLNALGRR